MRALVLAVGRPFHWGHIALSLEISGYETFIVDYQPGLFSEYAKNGIFFDLIITTRHGASCVHNEIFTLREVDFRKFKFNIVIYQYDDVFSEVSSYFALCRSFEKHGFSVRTHIWLYCKNSYEFLREKFPAVRAFFSHSPLYEDIVICFNDNKTEFSCEHRKVETLISPLSSYLDRISPHRDAEFSSKIVYFGSYNGSFYKDFNLSQEDDLFISNVVSQYMENRTNTNVWDFINFSIEKGCFKYEEESINRISLFSWYFSYVQQKNDRLSIIQDIRHTYGDTLFLVGPGWNESGVKSFPTNFVEPMAAYASASVCLDLGSQFIDSCLYQRSLEIILAGGNLLQKKASNTKIIFDEYSSEFSFENSQDFQEKYNDIKHDGRSLSRASAFRKRMFDVFLKGNACIQAVLTATAD